MSQYEFSDVENATIAATGSRAKVWSIMAIVSGAFSSLIGVLLLPRGGFIALLNLVSGPVTLVMGITILGVAGAFKSIVDTKGNDLGHMMVALKKLNTAYTIQIIAMVIGFFAGAAGGAAGLR